MGNSIGFFFGKNCPEGYILESVVGVGDLCYPPCRDGYSRTLIPFCAADCPSGWHSTDVACNKPVTTCHRSAGFITQAECLNYRNLPCIPGPPNTVCERIAGLWHPRCGPGFESNGIDLCSSACPANTRESGVGICYRDTYSQASQAVTPSVLPWWFWYVVIGIIVLIIIIIIIIVVVVRNRSHSHHHTVIHSGDFSNAGDFILGTPGSTDTLSQLEQLGGSRGDLSVGSLLGDTY